VPLIIVERLRDRARESRCAIVAVVHPSVTDEDGEEVYRGTPDKPLLTSRDGLIRQFRPHAGHTEEVRP
jgi:hypothetical protein